MRARVLAKDAAKRRSLRSTAFMGVAYPPSGDSLTRAAQRRTRLSSVGVWEERAGRNEALFREVNETVAKLEERLGASNSEVLPIICECALTDCLTRLEISLAEYGKVRQHPHHFIVARGHEQPDVEHVVRRAPEYVVVEKDGVAAAAADVT
jgi:hypothetical protein